MRLSENTGLPEQQQSIEVRRDLDNGFVVTPDTKMVNIETGEFTMTHGQWMDHGREVGIRARVALIDKGIPGWRRGRTLEQDEKDLAALARIEARSPAALGGQEQTQLLDVDPQNSWTPEQRQLRAELDALYAERAETEAKSLATFLGALAILENEPDSPEGIRLADHIRGAGEVQYPTEAIESIVLVAPALTEAA